VLLLGATVGAAATPVLLRDVNTFPNVTFTQQFVATGGKLFFPMGGPAGNDVLAVIDATADTLRTFDVRPGFYMIPFGGSVIFDGSTDAHGTEPWISDGTVAGTHELADIKPDADSSFPAGFANIGNAVIFSAIDVDHGSEPWVTDGTSGGTHLFRDLIMGQEGSFPQRFAPADGNVIVFFNAMDPSAGFEPFIAALGGAGLLADIYPGGSSDPVGFTSIPNQSLGLPVVFGANSGDGRELWKSDGTDTGTTLVKEINTGPGGSEPGSFVQVGDVVVFTAFTAGTGRELWRTDATTNGTTMISDVVPGPFSGARADRGTRLGTSRFVLPALFPGMGYEPAVTDGATLTQIADVLPGAGWGWDADGFPSFVATTSYAWTGLDDGIHGRELWRTDGTTGGTSMFADIAPGKDSSAVRPVAAEGETLYFLATGLTGYGVWKTTATGTTLLADLSQPGTQDGFTGYSPAAMGGQVYFGGFDREAGGEPWATDGTPDGTHRVADINPGSAGSGGEEFIAFGDHVYFRATDPGAGTELFTSDGTAAGTHLVKDISPGPGGSFPNGFVTLGDRLLFAASVLGMGQEPWVSDGTPDGTQLLMDVAPGPDDSYPAFVIAGGRAFFTAYGGTKYRLFVTDGTPGGTLAVSPDGTYANNAIAFGGGVLFEGDTSAEGDEPWVSDGTIAGTHLLLDINPAGHSNPQPIAQAGTRAFFVASTPATGRELWATDGTAAGTQMLTDATPDTSDFYVYDAVAIGDRVVFTTDALGGLDLFVSDGTMPGTQPLQHLCDDASRCSSGVFKYETTAFFAYDDGVHGRELWQTDGTPAGTAMVADVVPGPDSFGFESGGVAVLGGRIFLAGCDAAHGCEPWILDWDQCPADPGKLAPGTCGCGVADADADADAIADCLIGDEFRHRIAALRALIDPLRPARGKSARAALRAQLAQVRTALADLLAYHDGHEGELPDVTKLLAKARKGVTRLARGPGGLKGHRRKALKALDKLDGGAAQAARA